MTSSRRDFIVGAGAGLVVGLPAVGDAASRPVGIAPEARESIGVIGTILQDGPVLTGFGWLTQVAGLDARDLFTDPSRRGAGTHSVRVPQSPLLIAPSTSVTPEAEVHTPATPIAATDSLITGSWLKPR